MGRYIQVLGASGTLVDALMICVRIVGDEVNGTGVSYLICSGDLM